MLVDAQSEWQNFARDKGQMRVLNVPEQKLCASIENDNAHARDVNR
jgi:hypothetical protein